MNSLIKFLTVSLLLGIVFSDNFIFEGKYDSKSSFLFIPDQLNIDSDRGYSRLSSSSDGKTIDEGMPELPIYTTFFQMDPEKTYSVSYNVISSHVIEDIDVYPSQGQNENVTDSNFIFNSELHRSHSVYPQENISLSEPMIMRDFEVGLITFIPFSYSAKNKTLEVFDEVEIDVVEVGDRIANQNLPQQRSLLFEPMYEQIVANYEPLDSRDEYQTNAILYICGGSSIDHPYVEELVAWRRSQGYVVYTASTSEIGGTGTGSISNYIETAYNNFDPSPEIVGLIGDTGGSYPISTYTIQGGSGDNEYQYIEGNDFLPEIFIGRISVSSSSDISNIINKTLVYEKAESQNDYWYERAALVGDPSSSGISTVTTNQYIQNVMEVHGMTDIQTNYGGGNYNSWVDEAFDDDANSQGVLYYNYRGYYGSSSISVSGMDSGAYAPFAATITCGTGDFGGTSDSENFIRTGSVSSPKGAVACVGVATTSTHTMYNNIVNMGIYEGLFSFGMYHAGASLAQGKLALLRAYPTDPYQCVTKFSQWSNLMGDPALHLWTDTPQDFTVNHDAQIPSGINSLDVSVYDESGAAVNDARVILLNDNNDLFTAYTDSDGMATVEWLGDLSGDVSLNVFKHNYRLHEGTLNIGFVEGPALYLDQTRLSVSDQSGNNNGMLNSGETVDVEVSIMNLGSESANSLSISTQSNNNNVSILEGDFNVISMDANESLDLLITLHVSELAIDYEDLDITLSILDANDNLWNIDVPIRVYAPKLDINNYIINNTETLEPGIESNVDLIIVNTGSIALDNARVEFISSDKVTFISDAYDLGTVNVGQEVTVPNIDLIPSDQIINGTSIIGMVNYFSDGILKGNSLVTFSVGTRNVDDPTGPDEYGYYMFDSGDTDYPIAPEYNWIEIVGNGGQSLDFQDAGNGCESSGGGWYGCDNTEGNDVTADVQLPFDFKFYGETYDQITVSTNGYISFIDNEMSAFRNYSVPGAGGPTAMVAAFWDDLKTGHSGGTGNVYKYVTDDYVIIEWYEMETYQNDSDQNFQMIIYNPETMGHATPSGDGEIIIQYKEFNNTTQGDYSTYTPTHGCYATVGLENHYGNIGLEYTFDDEYSAGSRELSDDMALLITTSAGSYGTLGDVNQDEILNVLDIVITVNIILSVVEPTNYQLYAADINGDSTLNVLDVVQLVNLILNS